MGKPQMRGTAYVQAADMRNDRRAAVGILYEGGCHEIFGSCCR